MKKTILKENEIQSFILDFLKIKKTGLFWRNNTVGVYDPTRNIYRKNSNQLKGVPDILGILRGKFIAIECKRGDIKKLSADQELFKEEFENNGGIFYLANDIDKFRFWFEVLIKS